MSIRFRLLYAVLLALVTSWAAFSQNYTIATFAGGGLPVNIPATSANFYRLKSIALDKAGNIFFVDLDTVLRLDAASGALTLVAGTGGAGFSGDDILATNSLLNQPQGIAIDSAGDIFIADTANNRVRKVTNGVITTIAGNGTAGFSGDNGPATSAQLNAPAAVALDATGYLYIADSRNQRIRKISNGVITTIAGNGTESFGGDNGPASGAGFYQPQGVAVDSAGNVYIADTGNNVIREVSNGIVTTIAGNNILRILGGFGGDGGPAANALLSTPQAVALDSSGHLYIADGNRVREISNGTINTVAGNGSCCYSGDTGPAIEAELYGPEGIVLDSVGSLYIIDRQRIRKVSAGVITTLAGGGAQLSFSGPPTSARLDTPGGVAADTTGNVFFADTFNNRVFKVSGGVITSLAGTGVAGFSGDNGPAASAQLNKPWGIAIDSAGNLYISDRGNNRIRKVVNGVISTVAGNGARGFGGAGTFSGDHGPATSAGLNLPVGIALDSTGNLYIADTFDNCIRMVSNGVITTVAGVGTAGNPILGPSGTFSGDNGPATSAFLNGPSAVVLDHAGNLYIADTGNYRIRKVSAGIITTIAGNGTPGFSGDNGPATSAELFDSVGLAVDPAGNLYIADSGNGVVRKLSNGVITTVAGIGGSAFVGDVGDGGPATGAALVGPAGVAIDPSGNIYIADSGNNRIRVLTPPGPLVISPGGIVPVYSTVSTVQSGSWISIFGANLAAGTFLWNADFPQTLGSVSVNVDNKPAYLWFVSPAQINLQVPDDNLAGTVSVAVTTPSGTATSTVTLAPYAPSFSLFGDGRHVAGEIAAPGGAGAYANGTYDLVGPSNTFSYSTRPVSPGETLTLYGVGFGPTTPHVSAGQVFSGSAPMSTPVTITIGGVKANVVYSGITEAGLYQFNVIVPPNAGTGDQPLQASVNGVLTPAGPVVTLQ